MLKPQVATDNAGLVVVIATGGTIAQSGSRIATTDVGALLAASGADGPIESLQVSQVTSPNITVDHWVKLARLVNKVAERSEVVGIVVTHGTDTLEETAFFLDLTCCTPIPIVLVGAMRQSNSPESDGEANLRHGIALARSTVARGRGVLVAISGEIHSARDVTKRHSRNLDAFESPNLGVLGSVRDGLPSSLPTLLRLPRYEVPASLRPVPIVYGHVGITRKSLHYIQASSPPGLVFAGTGGGSIPDNLLGFLTSLASHGTVVVRSSRTGAGPALRNDEVDDDGAGFVAAEHLNPQKAAVLLSLSLVASQSIEEIQAAFQLCSAPARTYPSLH